MRRFLSDRLTVVIAAVVVVVIAAVGGGVLAFGGGGELSATAYFDKTVGLYAGNSIRILGVPVGKVTKVTAEGTRVRVDFTYSKDHPLPAEAKALIIPPSIVSDRYIELTPVYTGGPKLRDHGTIPQSRTASPLELDQIFANLNDLNKALGPNGANKNGALSRLVDVGASNLGNGNGDRLHDALSAFSQAISTLSDSRANFFGTLTNLQAFTATLKQHDSGVRKVNDQLAQVSTLLDQNRSELDAALRNLAVALAQVGQFVRDNRDQLTSDVSGLADLTNTLVKQKRAITEFLDDAPLGLQNLTLAYNADYHTLDSRGDVENSSQPGNPTNPACMLYTAITNQPCPSLPALSPSQVSTGSASADILRLLRGAQ